MDYFYFLLTLLHVLSGLLFVGLPTVACLGSWFTGASGWRIWLQCLWHALMAGVIALAGGLLLAGFQWNDSFDQAWSIVGRRWIFAFLEFAFSAGLIFAIAAWVREWPQKIWLRWLVIGLLCLAATNSLYHFPALMVVSREIRLHPERILGLEGAVVRQLLFAPNLLFRWLHLAFAGVFFAAVWTRFLIGLYCDELKDKAQTSGAGTEMQFERLPTERILFAMLWSILLTLGLTGLATLLYAEPARLELILTLGAGKSNALMIGTICALVAALPCCHREPTPTALGRFLEVGLVIAATAAMIV